MNWITSRSLAILLILIPTGVYSAFADYPFDLSKWIKTKPPRVGDDRWSAANYDTEHRWVVYLSGDRPSARLRAAKRAPGSPDPQRQEAYPPMPFVIEQGSAKEGLAGERFSVQVSDGWIVGFNAGEWGGRLWWFSPDGSRRYMISEDQVVGFLKTDAGLLALEGLAHMGVSRGRLVKLSKGDDGGWRSEKFVDLGGAPAAAALGTDGTLTLATNDRLLRVHLESKQIDVLLKDAFWGGLYPESMIVAPTGAVYLGMRHGVVEVEKVGATYKANWLIPSPEFDRPRLDRGR
jgi:hypothetical protein